MYNVNKCGSTQTVVYSQYKRVKLCTRNVHVDTLGVEATGRAGDAHLCPVRLRNGVGIKLGSGDIAGHIGDGLITAGCSKDTSGPGSITV